MEGIKIRKYHRAIDDEFYNHDHSYFDNFKEIIRQFGRKNCVRKGKRIYVFKENSILMYERASGKLPEEIKPKRKRRKK